MPLMTMDCAAHRPMTGGSFFGGSLSCGADAVRASARRVGVMARLRGCPNLLPSGGLRQPHGSGRDTRIFTVGHATLLFVPPARGLADGLDGEPPKQVPLRVEVTPIIEVRDRYRHFRAELERPQVGRVIGQLPVHLLALDAGDADPDELGVSPTSDRRLAGAFLPTL